jgi:DNA-binding HxlR family transcriptional regulator
MQNVLELLRDDRASRRTHETVREIEVRESRTLLQQVTELQTSGFVEVQVREIERREMCMVSDSAENHD